MPTCKRTRDGSTLAVVLCLFVLGVMAIFGGTTARADNPTPSTVLPQSPYQLSLDENFRGGSLVGYGKSYALATTTSASAIAYTTSVSADGVRMIDFVNTGTNTVLISIGQATVSTAVCTVYLPASMAYRYRGKKLTTYFRYYSPAGNSTLVVAE